MARLADQAERLTCPQFRRSVCELEPHHIVGPVTRGSVRPVLVHGWLSYLAASAMSAKRHRVGRITYAPAAGFEDSPDVRGRAATLAFGIPARTGARRM
jgi:hypothetical protein